MDEGLKRVSLAILLQALEDAKSNDEAEAAEAQHWLTCEKNRLRELIIDVASNLSQDDIDNYVKEIQDGSAEA